METNADTERLRQTAADLLMLIWRGIPPDYKSRYRMNIWEQFENQVRSAAYTSNLAKFVSSLCLKLAATVGTTPEDRQIAEAILNGGQDRAILKLLRDETTLLVLMVRVANQERREEWEANHPDRAAGGETKLSLFDDEDN
jgi:hypothetical protein